MICPGIQFCNQEKQMKKTILTFGLISGAVSAIMMVVTMLFSDRIGIDRGYVVGYTAIVLSFLLVFFGIRSYRDNEGNGQITFSRAFTVGICITLISCVFYVITWEVLYYNFMPDFLDKWGAHAIEKAKAAGASAAAIQLKVEEFKKYKVLYANPLTNAAVTFIEPFPIGLLITLISAAVLKRKPEKQENRVVATAS
jgi:hypothetical protein